MKAANSDFCHVWCLPLVVGDAVRGGMPPRVGGGLFERGRRFPRGGESPMGGEGQRGGERPGRGGE